jgi:hypothetical protein
MSTRAQHFQESERLLAAVGEWPETAMLVAICHALLTLSPPRARHLERKARHASNKQRPTPAVLQHRAVLHGHDFFPPLAAARALTEHYVLCVPLDAPAMNAQSAEQPPRHAARVTIASRLRKHPTAAAAQHSHLQWGDES